MAKIQPKYSSGAKVKFRVFEFEMDGSDESIQDTMKTLAAALTRGGQGPIPVHRRIKADTPASMAEADTDDESMEEEEIQVQDVLPKTVQSPKKTKKLQTYEILEDIRFDETAIALDDFVIQYSLKSDLKRYLAIALWFKDQLKLPEINVRHWYTAFKYLKWTIPNDPAQPIRDLRAKKTLSKGTSVGHTYINHIGEKDLQPLFKNAA
jgi:hypothetical protein